MRTIFYKPCADIKDENGDYWFNNKPYKEWLVLENTLYEPDRNIIRTTVGEDGFIKELTITEVRDRFTDDGIIRRIAFYVAS